MSAKNKKQRGKICLVVLTSCIVLAGIWAVLATPETALAKKPENPGGGGEVGQEIPVCIIFDDTGRIKTDDPDNPYYCDGDLKKKVTAIVGRNFNIVLEPNNSNKTTAGRTLWLDLSVRLWCEHSVQVDVVFPEEGICDDCFDELVPALPAERFGVPSFTSGYPDNAQMVIEGRDLDGLRPLPGNNTVETNARLSFSVGGQDYALRWGPFKSPGGTTHAPGSDPVLVTRVDNDTWTFETTGEHLACLYIPGKAIQGETVYLGQFTMPFSATAVAIEHEDSVWGDEPHGIVMGEPACQ